MWCLKVSVRMAIFSSDIRKLVPLPTLTRKDTDFKWTASIKFSCKYNLSLCSQGHFCFFWLITYENWDGNHKISFHTLLKKVKSTGVCIIDCINQTDVECDFILKSLATKPIKQTLVCLSLSPGLCPLFRPSILYLIHFRFLTCSLEMELNLLEGSVALWLGLMSRIKI